MHTSGVMCLDFHPQHPNLLAVGSYDGSVSVYDVRRPTKPLYTSTAATGKHTDPVWEIFWQVNPKQCYYCGAMHSSFVSTFWHWCINTLLCA